jgi:hypothetical protein
MISGITSSYQLLVILLWHSFIYEEINEWGVLINPPIVSTFMRQRWSGYHLQFISSFAGVKIKYTHYFSSTYFFSVLRIHDILVWIQIRGSMPLTNGSGSGSFYFHH